MDTSEQYTRMMSKAWSYLKDGIDRQTIDWRQQAYCERHKVRVGEDHDGAPRCPIFDDWLMQRSICTDQEYADARCDSDWIPLLYQDQLQAMVRRRFVFEELNAFNNWFDDAVLEQGMLRFDTASWEQLWLAAVMHWKYGKTWNGEDWS